MSIANIVVYGLVGTFIGSGLWAVAVVGWRLTSALKDTFKDPLALIATFIKPQNKQ